MKVRITLEGDIDESYIIHDGEGQTTTVQLTKQEIADTLDETFSLSRPFETDFVSIHINSRRLEWLP